VPSSINIIKTQLKVYIYVLSYSSSNKQKSIVYGKHVEHNFTTKVKANKKTSAINYHRIIES